MLDKLIIDCNYLFFKKYSSNTYYIYCINKYKIRNIINYNNAFNILFI